MVLRPSRPEPNPSLSGRRGWRRAAVVGGGVAGATAAKTLRGLGWSVQVFDKGRGPGGRASTRREGGWSFDHGAQFFTARDPSFVRTVEGWHARGVASPWRGRFLRFRDDAPMPDLRERWVGVPGMSAIVADLLRDTPVDWSTRVTAVTRRDGTWSVDLEGGPEVDGFDDVVIALPAPQAALLLADASPKLAERVSRVPMAPCWTVMVAFDAPVALTFDGATIDDAGPLAWVGRDASKLARRADAETWVLHASPAWSARHLEDDPEQVVADLVSAFQALVSPWCVLPELVHARAHRWRYARTLEPVGRPFLADPARSLVVTGDWLLGARIEAAYLSGRTAAYHLLSAATPTLAAR